MNRSPRLLVALAACTLLTGPAWAADVIGAGSGSTGGTIDGKTNETSPTQETGTTGGGTTVPSQANKPGAGTGDNAVLNAPRETVPGTQPKSQPSNLNGQNPQQ